MRRSTLKNALHPAEPLRLRRVRCPAVAASFLALVLASCGSPADNGSPHVPTAGFSATCTNVTCSFTDQSSDADGAIVSRNWDFGDGATSNEVNPEHIYPATGIYSVQLKVVDDSGATSVHSQAVAVGDTGLVFMGAGDIADCSSDSQAGTTAALILKNPTAAVYTLGDNAYPNGSPANYRQCYDPTWGQFKDRTHPAPGNHDYNTGGAAGYFGYFGAVAGPANRGYYSYDLGSWHIISLDSEIDVSGTGAQATWLRQDLIDHPARCTLAYWHKPLFTSGLEHQSEVSMRPIFTILYDAGADVVLSGHNHQYERFAPQRPDGTRDDASGIREFVAGTGGAGLYDFAAPQPNSEVRSKTFGVLKLTLAATSYVWEFIPVDGSSFSDGGTGACH